LSATPRCPMLWCLADLCRCPFGLLGSAWSTRRGRIAEKVDARRDEQGQHGDAGGQ
jgi:hypothetical protein